MKRFHLHLAVENLEESVAFYSGLFGVFPSVRKEDYAKWMLDDPKINLAISTRGLLPGLDHLGIQVDSEEELAEVKGRMGRANLPVAEQSEASCCYSRSDKYWTVDPQGIAWEAFHTLSDIPVFGERESQEKDGSSCCVPTFPIRLGKI